MVKETYAYICETPRTMYVIESTPEPTPKSDDLCYDDDCFKGSGWWWDKDGLFHYKSEKDRNGWEVKIGNRGFEFGMHWRR
ncbi:MAG: hypothetical protein LBB44_01000 [Endomicrobium sp.]|jgi:hypothetical protein|nr:hypothetical protein [Endomicrobium sp.]